MVAAAVRCREIAPTDLEAVAALLTRGFVGRSRDYWLRGLHRQGARPIPDNCPRYGFLLESGGAPVGVLLLLYTNSRVGGDSGIRCNVSSWYVEPAFRNYASLLTSMAQKNKQVTYINISPAATTWPIIEAQGFQRYCSGFFFALPLLAPAAPGQRIERVTPATAAVAGLSDDDLAMLKSHADYGCLSLVCHGAEGPQPFILVRKRARSGRVPLPAMQLVYCRDTQAFTRCAGALGRYLARRGYPVVIIDANGALPGLVGVYSAARGRKYFKGPHRPRLADLTDTELVLYGP